MEPLALSVCLVGVVVAVQGPALHPTWGASAHSALVAMLKRNKENGKRH